MKKIATFGLRISTMTLSTKARRADFGAMAIGSAAGFDSQHADAEPDEVDRADDLHRHVEFRHMPEDRGESEGRGDHVGVAADMDAERRHEAGAPSAGKGLRGGVEERGSRKIGEDKRRDGKSNEEIGGRHECSFADRSGAERLVDALHIYPDLAPAGQSDPPGGLVGDAEFEHAGLAVPITSIASVITAPSTQPPETEPRKLPSSSMTRWLPTGRGADPQVSTTVARATPLPARFQASASLRMSVSVESMAAPWIE